MTEIAKIYCFLHDIVSCSDLPQASFTQPLSSPADLCLALFSRGYSTHLCCFKNSFYDNKLPFESEGEISLFDVNMNKGCFCVNISDVFIWKGFAKSDFIVMENYVIGLSYRNRTRFEETNIFWWYDDVMIKFNISTEMENCKYKWTCWIPSVVTSYFYRNTWHVYANLTLVYALTSAWAMDTCSARNVKTC